METVTHCGLCGSDNIMPLAVRPDGLPIHECADCGFSFVAQKPNDTALAAYYSSDYFQGSQTYQDYFDYARAIVDLDYCPRLQRLGPFISRWEGKNILEVGCAAGGTLAVLKRKGTMVSGIEISEAACRVAASQFGLQITHDSLDNMQLPEACYDGVMMFDVLEHLREPGCALVQMSNALKENGFLAVTVPNFDRFDKEGLNWPGLQGYYEHLNYFRSRVLCRKLTDLGMYIVDAHTYTTGMKRDGSSEKRSIRNKIGYLKRKYSFLSPPLRVARKLRFLIQGPTPLNRFYNGEGMDLFVLARKSQ